MNKGIAWTVLSCIAFMAIILSLFISSMNTTRELTEQEYKDLGVYFIDPPRQLSGFDLIDHQGNGFTSEDFKDAWNILFFGFTFFDSEPEKVRATILNRGGWIHRDDKLDIALDTYLDRRNAYLFELNPLGTQDDALITDENRPTLDAWAWD